MIRKLLSSALFVLVLGLATGASAGRVGQMVVNDGDNIVYNERMDMDDGDTLTVNGGEIYFNAELKFPDSSGNQNVHIYMHGGYCYSANTQSYADRGSYLHIGAGTFRTCSISEEQRDPRESGQWNIDLIDGCTELVFTQDGDCVEVSAVCASLIEFESAASGDFETVSPAVLTVILSEAQEQIVTVDYAVTGGTATGGGVDYELAGACSCDFDGSGQVNFHDLATFVDNWLSQTTGNIADVSGNSTVDFEDFATLGLEWYDLCVGGTLQFEPGETAKTISIDIINDGLDEENETILVELSNLIATSDEVELGANAQHTYTIIDPRPRVSFASAAGSGSEGALSVNLEASLSPASTETVTADYSVTGGTATGGVDYALPDGTVTFDPGVTVQNISITVVDDGIIEENETIVISLSNPTGNALLGTRTEYTYTITDNEVGVVWDGLVWYYSAHTGEPFVNSSGHLEWDPEGSWHTGEQYITRIPEQRLSQPGDKVEITYWWLTDGKHDCPPDSCLICEGRCSDDIRCIAGTSDLRAGLFEADGEYVEEDGLDVFNSIFEGYKGYNFRFGPNMDPDIPTRWVDCDGEVHKTGNFAKKPEGEDNLMTYNRGLMDYIPGFGLGPGEWSLWTISLERLSSDTVRMSITLNGKTYTCIDDSGDDQPQKIDVFAIHMRNGRPYTRLVLANEH